MGRRRDLEILGAAAFALLAAWGPKLVPGYWSIDDYILVHGETLGDTLAHYAAQGRLGMAALHVALRGLGADPARAHTFLSLCAVGLLAVAAWLLVRVWDVEEEGAPALAAAAIAFVHPYASETWSFRIAPFYYALAMVMALGGLWLIRRGRERTLAGVALVAGSLAVYQVALGPLLVALLLGACIDLARVGPERGVVLKVWAMTAGAVLAACLLWFGAMQLALFLMKVPAEARAQLVALGDVPWRARQVWALFERFLWNDPRLSAPLLGVLQIALLGATLVALGLRRRGAVLSVALLFAALISISGVVALLRVFQPWPRSLTGLGVFWAGIVALLGVLTGRSRAVVALAAALGMGWAAIDHRVAADQVRLNARELARAGRVLERLERHPRWGELRSAAFVGHPRDWPDLPSAGDLNASALHIYWSQAALLTEASGRNIAVATPGEREHAERHCAAAPKWPAEGSVTIDGGLGIACF